MWPGSRWSSIAGSTRTVPSAGGAIVSNIAITISRRFSPLRLLTTTAMSAPSSRIIAPELTISSRPAWFQCISRSDRPGSIAARIPSTPATPRCTRHSAKPIHAVSPTHATSSSGRTITPPGRSASRPAAADRAQHAHAPSSVHKTGIQKRYCDQCARSVITRPTANWAIASTPASANPRASDTSSRRRNQPTAPPPPAPPGPRLFPPPRLARFSDIRLTIGPRGPPAPATLSCRPFRPVRTAFSPSPQAPQTPPPTPQEAH